ncbi:hypothetical protein Bca4012_016876 [Brassica carinata]
MEFWGVEVEAGKSLKVKPDFESLIHVSQASLDKGKKGETALLYVTVDGKKLVLGTLSRDNIPQINFDLVFEKEFELSHSLVSGSVHFVGYKSPNMVEEDDFSDLEEEEEEAAAVPAAVTANVVKADSKPKAKLVEVKPESDEDEDDSDEEEDDSEENGSDSEKGMDVDEDDSEDEEEEDSEEEKEETPKKPEVSNKKRPNESASKTPLSAKKAKPATPHPAKKGGKSPINANQSPKSGGQSSNKKQFNSGKQFGSNNKGKGKGKGRA